MKIDAELFDLCKEFIKENKITCEDDIYQGEPLQENLLELLQQICDLIGFHEEEDIDVYFDEE